MRELGTITDVSSSANSEPSRKTPIGEFPESWRLLSLGELFEIQQGKALSPASRLGNRRRPFLRTANVLWGRLDLSSLDQMDFTESEENRLALARGDLLVCEGGEIGRTALWRGELTECLYQNHIHRLRRRGEEVDPEFVMYWLQAAFLRLGLYGGVGNRTTIPNLSGARLKQLAIPVPPPPEQREIAGVLRTIQSAVEVQDRIVAKLKELKSATMAKLFREGLRGEPLQQTEIGEIPESWEVVTLGDYFRVVSGGTPARDVPGYWNGAIPWVKTGEINYRPISSTEERITEQGLANSAAKLFPKGTLLMAMYGQGVTRGRVSFLEVEAATNQACAALIPSGDLDPGYLYSYCCFSYDRIRQLGHGANQKNLSADIIRSIRIPLPGTNEEQRKLYSIVRALDSRIEFAKRNRDIAEVLFRTMHRLLMTGQVRVELKAGPL